MNTDFPGNVFDLDQPRSGAAYARRHIRSSEIADATIAVSSLGERGVEALYGVIYPPQVAIVGIGKVVSRGSLQR